MLPPEELDYVNKALKKMKLKKLEDYYKTDRWKIVKQTLNTIVMRCYCCDCRDEKLELHHLTYKNLGNETQDDLVWVCRSCHESIHETVTDILTGEFSLIHHATANLHRFYNLCRDESAHYEK